MYKRIIWNSQESSVITSLEFLDKLVYSSFWELCIHQICGIWSGRDKKNSCWAQDGRKRKWMIWGTATMKIVSYKYTTTTWNCLHTMLRPFSSNSNHLKHCFSVDDWRILYWGPTDHGKCSVGNENISTQFHIWKKLIICLQRLQPPTGIRRRGWGKEWN